jgi:cytochrome c oxidase subunit 2
MQSEPGNVTWRKDAIIAGTVWLILTVIGELIVWGWIRGIMPIRYAETATIIDDAFLYLTALAVPVFTFVIAMVLVSLVRFGSFRRPSRDGASFRGEPKTFGLWLVVTGALALSLIIFPGLVGIAQIRGQQDVNDPLLLDVKAARWAWAIEYPEGVLVGDEPGESMVLPLGRPVRFEITSVDILHSFWIPAFRVKIDAVPGAVTQVTVTPDKPGAYPEEPLMRIQCAELCGLNHSTMALPIRVVEEAEFEQWLAEQQAAGEATCEPEGTELAISALDIAFDTDCLAAPADTPISIAFDNKDPDIPHNVSIATDPDYTDFLWTGEIFPGVEERTYEVPALAEGTYYFQCDVHPIPAMRGTFIVK